MTQTVSGLFDSFDDAKQAIHDLEAAGVPHHDISVVSNNAKGEHDIGKAHQADEAGKDAGTGAGVGGAIGGVGGLLAGLGLLAIPGLGPIVAVGWLASTAVGAVVGGAVGAAAGGIVGALTHAGVPEHDANVYAEGVRRGGTLITAKVADDKAMAARTVLTHPDRAVDVAARGQAYREQGWTRFDESAPVYTIVEVDQERTRYGRSV